MARKTIVPGALASPRPSRTSLGAKGRPARAPRQPAAAPEADPNAGTTRQARKSETRRALERAALQCFAEAGWEATTVGAIARQAGVAHGTFYVHFPTKEALADALLARFNAALEERLAPIWDQGNAALPTRVRRTAEAFLEHWEAERAFVAAYGRRLGGVPSLEAMRDGLNPPAVALLGGILERFAAAPGIGRKAPLMVQGLLAMWLRIGLQALFGPGIARADAVDVLTRMTLGAVLGMTGGK